MSREKQTCGDSLNLLIKRFSSLRIPRNSLSFPTEEDSPPTKDPVLGPCPPAPNPWSFQTWVFAHPSRRAALNSRTDLKDPCQGVRRILKKKKKKTKCKKKSRKDNKHTRADLSSHSSRSSESVDSTSGVSLDSQDSGHPFKEGHPAKQLAGKHPGLLTRHALDEMSRLLVQHVGEMSDQKVLPLFLRYLRLHVTMPGMSAAQKREWVTLGTAADRLIQRDILGGLDILTQRIKAIEW